MSGSIGRLPTGDSNEAMRAYQGRLAETGELPGYDRAALAEALRRGRFA